MVSAPGPCAPLLGCSGSRAISRTHGLDGEPHWPERCLSQESGNTASSVPQQKAGCQEVVRAMAPQSRSAQTLGKRRKGAGCRQKSNTGVSGVSQGTLPAIGSREPTASLPPLQSGLPAAARVGLCSLKPTLPFQKQETTSNSSCLINQSDERGEFQKCPLKSVYLKLA